MAKLKGLGGVNLVSFGLPQDESLGPEGLRDFVW